MQNKTNWLALLVAAIAGMAIGFLFYGALFMEQWANYHGYTIENDMMLKNGVEVPYSNLPMIINTVALLLYAFVLNWLVEKTNELSWAGGAKMGAIVGFFVFMSHYTSNRFAGVPTGLSMIDGCYAVVLLATMGAIVGGWRKK